MKFICKIKSKLLKQSRRGRVSFYGVLQCPRSKNFNCWQVDFFLRRSASLVFALSAAVCWLIEKTIARSISELFPLALFRDDARWVASGELDFQN